MNTAVMFILLTIYGSGTSIATIPFDSVAACENNRFVVEQAVKEQHHGSSTTSYISTGCVEMLRKSHAIDAAGCDECH